MGFGQGAVACSPGGLSGDGAIESVLGTDIGGVEAAARLLARATSATSGALAATGGPLAMGFRISGVVGAGSPKRSAGEPIVARYGWEITCDTASVCWAAWAVATIERWSKARISRHKAAATPPRGGAVGAR